MRRRQQRGDFLATAELGKVPQHVSSMIPVRKTGPERTAVLVVPRRQRNPLAPVRRLFRLRVVVDRLAGAATLQPADIIDYYYFAIFVRLFVGLLEMYTNELDNVQ